MPRLYQPPPLPEGLPVPVDDGAAAHLVGHRIPTLSLPSTAGALDLKQLAKALVLYVFPRMGSPDEPDPPGWDATPGARGCTQQSCGFRDIHSEFRDLGYFVAGIAAVDLERQEEASARLQLTFPLIADSERQLGRRLNLPTFAAAGTVLYKRLTLIADDGEITKVFYPVFPPDLNAGEAAAWLRSRKSAG